MLVLKYLIFLNEYYCIIHRKSYLNCMGDIRSGIYIFVYSSDPLTCIISVNSFHFVINISESEYATNIYYISVERQGSHCTGKTGEIVKSNSRQGKPREFENFGKTQGI